MITPLLVTIPEDFADLLRALCVARKAQQSLDIHDPMLARALAAQGLVEPAGAGWAATALLAEVSALPGSAAVLASQLRAAAEPAVTPVPSPTPTSQTPLSLALALATAPAPPAPASAGNGLLVTPRFGGYDGPLLRPPAAPGRAQATADATSAVPAETASFGVRPAPPSPGLIDPHLLRHVQVVGICLENLQQELDRLLAPSLAAALECPDPELRVELARSLPPCEMRNALLASVKS